MKHTRAVTFLLLASVCFLLTGCKSSETRANERACNEALRGGRVDVKDARLTEARAKLAIAEATCPGPRKPYVTQLRDELIAKEAMVRQEAERAAEEAKKRREHPVVPFMEWVRKKSVSDMPTEGAECFEGEHPKSGWCEASHRVIDGPAFRARFWKNEPRAARFGISVDSRVVCEDLGEHRVVRSWVKQQDAGRAERTHCDLTSRSHRGLAVLISVSGAQTTVEVFNQAYLKHDKPFAEMLRRQGR